MSSFDEVSDEIQMRVRRDLLMLRHCFDTRLGESIEISLSFGALHSNSTFWELPVGQRRRGRR